jgi:hypothetical protein
MKRIAIIVLSFVLLIVILFTIAVYVPIPLDPYLDFQVLHRADRGILQGIPLYDREAQINMVAKDLGVTKDQVFVLAFPYPPWYATLTLPLALLSIDVAARFWFLLNIAMLLASVWLLTDGWEPRRRLYSFIAAFLFLPVFGALVVGQYVFPPILGMALVTYALRHQRVGLTALGLALVTFKPHIGVFVLAIVLVHLLLRRDDFGRRAFWWTAFVGIFLCLIGFFADKAWPVTYIHSLLTFKSGVFINFSLPNSIARLFGWNLNQAFWIALIVLGATIALYIGSRHRLGQEAPVVLFVCMALLVNPYMQNYDFAFALVPLLYLTGSARSKMDWLWLALAFILPVVGLILFEREGNYVLLVSTLIMISVILTRLYKGHTIFS